MRRGRGGRRRRGVEGARGIENGVLDKGCDLRERNAGKIGREIGDNENNNKRKTLQRRLKSGRFDEVTQ